DRLVRKKGQPSPTLCAGGFKLTGPLAVIGVGGDRWRVIDEDRIVTLEPGKPPTEVSISQSTAAAFGPDGSWALCNSQRGLVRLDVATGKQVRVVAPRPRHAFAIALSADGSRAAVAYTHLIECWDLPSGKLLRKVKNLTWARWAAISPDGARVATRTRPEAYGLYQLANTDRGLKLEARDCAYQCCFLSNDRLLVDGRTKLCAWDLNRREVVAEAQGGECGQLQVSADGTRVILIEAEVGKILDALTLKTLTTFEHAARIGWDADGHVLGVNQSGVRKIHRDTGKELAAWR
ncbi:MAG: hypothetical protein H6Q89_4437, partial [Myxococcaceae bacterium]|nr:hypothetical protein [Myxococcaceae bacterium]